MQCFWSWTTFPGSTSWKGWPLSGVNTEALSQTSIWRCRGVSVNFKKPKAKLCHFLTASVTSATLISESSPSSPALLPLWGSPQFLSHSLKYSLQQLTITSVKVSTTLSPLYTLWKGGCLPFCSYLTVSQKCRDVGWKSCSMAYPNSSYIQVFASRTARTSLQLSFLYLSAAFWVSQPN